MVRRRPRLSPLSLPSALAFSLTATLHCGGSTATAPPDTAADAGPDAHVADGGTPPVPAQHNPTACTTQRPPGHPNTPEPPQSTCASDADCTMGTSGRCNGLPIGSGPPSNACSYDQCSRDSDCMGGQVCVCRVGGSNDANVCMNSGCRSDVDCGQEYCSPSLVDYTSGCFLMSAGMTANIPPGSVGYFCHAPTDECVNDSDCSRAAGPGEPRCVFSPDVGHWQCFGLACLGAAGGAP